MLHFSGKRPPRNYLGRREQFRLFTLFGMLALVVVLMRFAGRPESWTWFNALSRQEQTAAPTPSAKDEIDTRRAGVRASTDAPDVMRIGAAIEPPDEDATETLPGLRRDVFRGVMDDTVLRGGDEHAAFLRTLDVLQGMDEQSPAAPPAREVGFVQLFRQPAAYRGEWVRVRGIVRRALPIATPKNDAGIERLYQLWLQPADRPDDLLTIDVLQLPPGFPTGPAVKAPVSIDGVFFKRWAYHAEDDIRTAPLILARTVVWTPEIAPAEESTKFGALEFGLSALAVLAVVGGLWFVWGGRTRRRDVPPVVLNTGDLAARDHGNDVTRMLAELRTHVPSDGPSERQPEARGSGG